MHLPGRWRWWRLCFFAFSSIVYCSNLCTNKILNWICWKTWKQPCLSRKSSATPESMLIQSQDPQLLSSVYGFCCTSLHSRVQEVDIWLIYTLCAKLHWSSFTRREHQTEIIVVICPSCHDYRLCKVAAARSSKGCSLRQSGVLQDLDLQLITETGRHAGIDQDVL